MKIAHIISTQFDFPPREHNGRIDLAHSIVEGLVARGHDVTVYAGAKAKTSAKHVTVGHPITEKMLGAKKKKPHAINNFLLLSKLYQDAGKYDVIHSHLDYNQVLFTPFVQTPTVTTMHWRLTDELINFVQNFRNKNFYFTPITNALKTSNKVPFTQTVYNGIHIEDTTPSYKPGTYLAFLGSLIKEKGIETALYVAKKTKIPLKIAGKIKPKEQAYFEKVVKPHIDGKLIQYLGSIPHHTVGKFLANAKALLFPVEWQEAHPLVTIEAMAAGTPLLAFRRAPLPELIKSGKHGYLVRTKEEMAQKVLTIDSLDRRACRKQAEKFTFEKMLDGYEAVYKKLATKHGKKK